MTFLNNFVPKISNSFTVYEIESKAANVFQK